MNDTGNIKIMVEFPRAVTTAYVTVKLIVMLKRLVFEDHGTACIVLLG